MRRALLASTLLLTGCFGSWSNKDLEFAAALPVKGELQSKLPTRPGGQPLSGEGTRRDGLGLGEPSQAYLDAKDASTKFNGLLDGILTIVEAVRNLQPTRREADARFWGPFPDDKNTAYEVQLFIRRVDEVNFAWAIQYRLKQGPGEWFDVVTGNFLATGGVRKGKGKVVLLIAQNVAKLKTLEAFGAVGLIEMGYQTDVSPITVDMVFTFSGNDAGVSELGYGYREDADKAGKINFGLRTTNPDVLLLDVIAGWIPSGAGVAAAEVREGNYTGAKAIECWDERFNTSHARQNWDGGVNLGSPSACATLPF